MNYFLIGVLIMQAARLACGTCVFESEFGFLLNCNIKKSGLFRVRNLGGLKAHFGLGFSLGDELGFGESLGNLEDGRRRAISYKNGPNNLVGVLPAAAQPASDKHITARSTGGAVRGRGGSGTISTNASPKRLSMALPLMTEARPLPLGVPAFRPIPQPAAAATAQRRNSLNVDSTQPRITVNNRPVQRYAQPIQANRTFHAANPVLLSQPVAVPEFQAMPHSVARITNVLVAHSDDDNDLHHNDKNQQNNSNNNENSILQLDEEPKFDLKDVTVEELAAAANVSVATIKHAIYVREQQMKAEHRAMLAAKLRQEFMRTSTTTTRVPRPPKITARATAAPATATTTTTTTMMDANYLEQNRHEHRFSKVMNAPKEYYPVGYDKNFDDNFKSKVDLPQTSFVCGKQKHFPGLYADMDLGCMVFHVCALTDDGLVRKSFLCPENTLFDQTILKCNWWFYVDCNASKSVYDSNIPISKSYQLMKSLTYFAKYANNRGGDDSSGLNIQTLQHSMNVADKKEKDEAAAQRAAANNESTSNQTEDTTMREAES